MNFLRALFWIVLTVVVVVFSMRNWTMVPVGLFGGLIAYVKLPVLLLVALLAGWGPTYGWHRWWRWRMERRLAAAEHALGPVAAEPVVVRPAAPDGASSAPLPFTGSIADDV